MKQLFLTVILSITLGLHLIAQEITWEQTNGPSGGYLAYFHAGMDGAIFGSFPSVGGTAEVIYRSLDYGNNWETTSLEGEYASVIGVNNAGHVFAWADSVYYRSIDNGTTWQQADLPIGSSQLVQSEGDTLYAYGYGLFMSVDNGQTWTTRDTTAIYEMEVNSAGDLIRLVDDEFQISTDDGETWSNFLTATTSISDVYSFAIGNNDTLFVGTYEGIFRVSPDGSTAERVGENYWNINQVVASPSGTIYAQAYLTSLIMSRDNGNTWQSVFLPGFHTIYISVNNEGVVYVGSIEGITRSDDDGETWENAHEGIYQADVQFIVSDDAGNIYTSTSGRIFRTTDKGDSWDEIFVEPYDNYITDLTVTSDGDLYFISHLQLIDKSTIDTCMNQYCSYLVKSTDMGETWDTIFNSMSIGDVEITSNGDIYISTHFGLRRSTDGGESWEPIIEETNGDILFDEPRGLMYVVAFDQLYRSDNLGQSWSTFDHPGISYIELQVNSRGDLILTSTDFESDPQENRFYISTDQGETWNDFTPDGIPARSWIYVGLYDQLYIFTYSAMLRSHDNGTTWENMGSTPNVQDITQLADGQIFAAVFQNSVWKSTSLVPVNNYPIADKQMYIYPNPARENILVEFPGVKANDMLRLYDSKGQMVRETRIQQPSITLNIADLKKGIYLLKIGEAMGKVIIY